MGLETQNRQLSQGSMEEIEIFETAESPTGERIKLFVDELEVFEPIVDSPREFPRDFPLQSCMGDGVDLDFMLDIDAEIE